MPLRRKKTKVIKGEVGNGEDRISLLPIDVRELILDMFPMKDAIGTSILSSKWRYVWTGKKKLKFDPQNEMFRRKLNSDPRLVIFTKDDYTDTEFAGFLH